MDGDRLNISEPGSLQYGGLRAAIACGFISPNAGRFLVHCNPFYSSFGFFYFLSVDYDGRSFGSEDPVCVPVQLQ